MVLKRWLFKMPREKDLARHAAQFTQESLFRGYAVMATDSLLWLLFECPGYAQMLAHELGTGSDGAVWHAVKHVSTIMGFDEDDHRFGELIAPYYGCPEDGDAPLRTMRRSRLLYARLHRACMGALPVQKCELLSGLPGADIGEPFNGLVNTVPDDPLLWMPFVATCDAVHTAVVEFVQQPVGSLAAVRVIFE